MHQIIRPPDNAFDILLAAWKKWATAIPLSIPSKSSMSMRDLLPIIPFLGVLELSDNNRAKFRMLGDQLTLLYKTNFKEAAPDKSRVTREEQHKLHEAIVDATFCRPQGTYVDRTVPGPGGEDWIYKTFSLPMTNRDGDTVYVIQVGKMTAPSELNPEAWKNILAFDFNNTRIIRVQGLDIGYGTALFDSATFPGVDFPDAAQP